VIDPAKLAHDTLIAHAGERLGFESSLAYGKRKHAETEGAQGICPILSITYDRFLVCCPQCLKILHGTDCLRVCFGDGHIEA